MKINTRKSVFETNSSSLHSIAVKRGTGEQELAIWKKKNPDCRLEFELGEFGWEARKHTSVLSRASYLWTLACSDDKAKADVRMHFIKKVLKKHGIKAEFQEVNRKKYDTFECCEAADGTWFYIDHAGDWYYSGLLDIIFSDEKFLIDFLFGDSYVLTYNDNDDYSDWLWSVTDGIERDEYDKGN